MKTLIEDILHLAEPLDTKSFTGWTDTIHALVNWIMYLSETWYRLQNNFIEDKNLLFILSELLPNDKKKLQNLLAKLELVFNGKQDDEVAQAISHFCIAIFSKLNQIVLSNELDSHALENVQFVIQVIRHESEVKEKINTLLLNKKGEERCTFFQDYFYAKIVEALQAYNLAQYYSFLLQLAQGTDRALFIEALLESINEEDVWLAENERELRLSNNINIMNFLNLYYIAQKLDLLLVNKKDDFSMLPVVAHFFSQLEPHLSNTSFSLAEWVNPQAYLASADNLHQTLYFQHRWNLTLLGSHLSTQQSNIETPALCFLETSAETTPKIR